MSNFEKDFKMETLSEMQDVLEKINKLLHQFESDTCSKEDINTLFRHVHTIKGNSQAAGFTKLSEFNHLFEDVISKVKQQDTYNLGDICLWTRTYLETIESALNELKKNLNYISDFSLATKLIKNLRIDELPKILIIDDETEIVDILEQEIKNCYKYSISKAYDSFEAYHLAKKNSYDFIITDYRMPVMSGGEFVKSIRNNDGPNKKTPIILLSAYRPNYSQEHESWENVFFIDKPISFEQLNYFIKCSIMIKKAS